jgi:hypothetical protein
MTRLSRATHRWSFQTNGRRVPTSRSATEGGCGRRVATVERMTIRRPRAPCTWASWSTTSRPRRKFVRRARTQAARRGAGRDRLGARGRPGGDRDGGDPGRPPTARVDEVSRPVGPGRRPARAGEHPGHPPCRIRSRRYRRRRRLPASPAPRSSLARRSATKTTIGSHTSAVRRGSSSCALTQ